MEHPALATLSQEELLHFAAAASAADQGGLAAAYLKEAASRADASAVAHYLLGAEYAQAGMYDRAIDAMEAALALDPGLGTARIQLALLLLGADNAARALMILEPFEGAEDGGALASFGSGLALLARDDLAGCAASLAAGIAANDKNPALNGDMQRIIDRIREAAPAAGEPVAEAPAREVEPDVAAEETASADLRHLFLSAYTGRSKT